MVFQAVGLTINVYNPTISSGSYIPRGTWFRSLHDEVGTWSHETAVNGGYKNASFIISGSSDLISEWLENGIGRHVELSNSSNEVIWEGFVNSMDAAVGGLRFTRGPLINISNRVRVTYTPVLDNTVSPPINGTPTTTILADNEVSKSAYGIFERVLVAGTVPKTMAEAYRDTYLADQSEPENSESVNPAQSENASVTINLLGYGEFLSRYYYANPVALTTTVTQKIKDVLAGDPNSLFSTDYSQIETNGTLTPNYELGDRTAAVILQGEVALGDASNRRYTLGVYRNQRIKYAGEPTTIKYVHNLGDIEQRISLFTSGGRVWAWDVLPGNWLQVSNFMVGRVRPGLALRDDPRNIFIESIRYTAPFSVEINGMKISTLPQFLARAGLGGI